MNRAIKAPAGNALSATFAAEEKISARRTQSRKGHGRRRPSCAEPAAVPARPLPASGYNSCGTLSRNRGSSRKSSGDSRRTALRRGTPEFEGRHRLLLSLKKLRGKRSAKPRDGKPSRRRLRVCRKPRNPAVPIKPRKILPIFPKAARGENARLKRFFLYKTEFAR